MVTVIVDTSVFIDYFRTGKGRLVSLIEQFKLGEIDVLVPTVVIWELWAGESMVKFEARQAVEELIGQFKIIDLTGSVAKLAGALVREKKILQIDSMIAATCLVEKAELATLNQKHFSKVPGLRLWKKPRLTLRD